MTETIPPEVLKDWPGHSGNWGRWPNDKGTINLVTEEVVLRGIKSATSGTVVSCARPLITRDPIRDTPTATHKMLSIGSEAQQNVNSASDEISFRVHGMANTHIDAYSHIGYRGFGFNGHPFADVVSKDGATLCDITDQLGITTRGVFVDVAAARGVRYLEPGDSVLPEELEAALAKSSPGDALIVRIGGTIGGGRAPVSGDIDRHGVWAGFSPQCIELIARHDISVVGSDSPSDTFPSPIHETCRSPVHTLALAIYGMPLLHNMDLETLARVSREKGRDTFMFSVTALNVPGATGSLCTPCAIF